MGVLGAGLSEWLGGWRGGGGAEVRLHMQTQPEWWWVEEQLSSTGKLLLHWKAGPQRADAGCSPSPQMITFKHILLSCFPVFVLLYFPCSSIRSAFL